MKHCLECFDIFSQSKQNQKKNKIIGVNGELKSSKSMHIKTGYPNLPLLKCGRWVKTHQKVCVFTRKCSSVKSECGWDLKGASINRV